MSDDEVWIKRLPNRAERHEALNKQDKDTPLYPFAGWSTGTMPQDGVVVAIEFLVPPPDMSIRILRLEMTRAQCAELATGLEMVARTPHVPPDEPS